MTDQPDKTQRIRPRRALPLAGGLALMLALATAAARQPDSPQAQDAFPAQMDAAMTRMHQAMSAAFSGDPDRDFAAMMIPHHQGAIDMAEIELRFGRDERLRRLAQGIIVEQQQEIAVMRQILAGMPPAQAAGAPAPMHDMPHPVRKEP